MHLARTALALLLASSSLALHAQDFSSLEERMSQRDFESAGLQKLKAQELDFLNRWLQERGLTASASGAMNARADRIGLPPGRNPANEIVRGRLLGSFRGWTSNAVIGLENGQVWQQTGGGSFGGVSLESPEVTIQQGLLSAWYLRVEG